MFIHFNAIITLSHLFEALCYVQIYYAGVFGSIITITSYQLLRILRFSYGTRRTGEKIF